MYTGLWPAILGIDGPVLIYEPVDHLTELPYYPAKVIDWLAQHPYGTGINHRLGAAGFVPYRDSQGVTRHLCLESVVNRSNWHDLSLPDSELPWATVNLLFPRRDVAKSGPEILAPAQARHLIRLQLHNLYDES
jgi:hypothetical protein